jgi:two-component system OmpR family response regulator
VGFRWASAEHDAPPTGGGTRSAGHPAPPTMPGMPTSPRVLVVEDDASVRDALVVALRGEGYEVQPEVDGTVVSEVLEAFRPDLAVLDVRLPAGPDGVSIARRIRAGSDLPIIFVTAADEVDDRLAGFDAGGDDYLVKPFSMAELLARVRALLRRADRLTSAVLQVGDLVVDPAARTAVRGDREIDLTRTEFDLLVALAERRGTVVSKQQLLGLVWDYDAYDQNLVEVHLSSLRRKLEEHGPRIIHTVRGAGYVLRT